MKPVDGRWLPEIGYLCKEGEDSFADGEIEEAVGWYELACAGTFRVTDYRDDLVARRFERYEELRQMVPWRSVRRLPVADPGHYVCVMTCRGRERSFISTWFSGVKAWRASHGNRAFAFLDYDDQGQALTFFDALRTAAGMKGFTALTLLEDDIVLAKNALDYITTYRPDPDVVLTSWFALANVSVPRVLPVLVCRGAEQFDCNQAITMPAATVHALLDSDVLKNWPEKHGADRIFGKVFPGKRVAIHYPNLVQHVGGMQSLVGNSSQGERTSPTFIGKDADALQLIR